jgi:AraC-like DNA-binding protein
MTNVDLTAYEAVPRPLVAIGNDYPASYELDWHRHRRGQLLYAAKGVVAVRTPQGAWVAPPERAVWIPGDVRHSVKMVGAVSTRSVLIEPDVWNPAGDRCLVVGVSPLLRSLLVAAGAIEREYDVAGRDGLVMGLLVAELARAPLMPLAVPFPASPALAAKCQAFLEQPSPHDSIDEWSTELGLGRRAFTRAFRRETGMSLRPVAPAGVPIGGYPAVGRRGAGNRGRSRPRLREPSRLRNDVQTRAWHRAEPLSLLSCPD